MAQGHLSIVGIGPGDLRLLTGQAIDVLSQAQLVVGYSAYLDLIAPLLGSEQIVQAYALTQEVMRATEAVEAAERGQHVAIVSSGDAGIYGMAGLVFDVLASRAWDPERGITVDVIPGVSALLAAAARVGAPLMHDFAAISLSDLLTPREVIMRRLRFAAMGDFVTALYNPRSQKRTEPFDQACRIFQEERSALTPVALVRQAYRTQETIQMVTVDNLFDADVDMLTIVIIGNSQTRVVNGRMVTPRGYRVEHNESSL